MLILAYRTVNVMDLVVEVDLLHVGAPVRVTVEAEVEAEAEAEAQARKVEAKVQKRLGLYQKPRVQVHERAQ